MVSAQWVVYYFLFISIAEVILVPAGYTAVSELVAERWQSTALGVVRLVNGTGSILSGVIALLSVTSGQMKYHPVMTNPLYANDFLIFCYIVFAVALLHCCTVATVSAPLFKESLSCSIMD